MSTSRNIHFQIDNPILVRLLEEQLRHIKGFSCDSQIAPDCIVISGNAAPAAENNGASVVLIPKGTVRLGEVLDRMRYVVSGREDHIEDGASCLEIGDFQLFPADNHLLYLPRGTVIRLTDKERLLLRTLHEAGAQGLSRRDLLKAVWGYADEAETHTLETHIYRLRQKLEPFNGQNIIRAMDGFYILNNKKPT